MKRLDASRHDFQVKIQQSGLVVSECLDVFRALGKVAGKSAKVYIEGDGDDVKITV